MNKPKISNARKTHIAEAKIFWKNVDYLKAINGLTDHDVACALKRSISTIYNRKSEPETTDLRDVYNAALYHRFGYSQPILFYGYKSPHNTALRKGQ